MEDQSQADGKRRTRWTIGRLMALIAVMAVVSALAQPLLARRPEPFPNRSYADILTQVEEQPPPNPALQRTRPAAAASGNMKPSLGGPVR
jgi:hypothetical protein